MWGLRTYIVTSSQGMPVLWVLSDFVLYHSYIYAIPPTVFEPVEGGTGTLIYLYIFVSACVLSRLWCPVNICWIHDKCLQLLLRIRLDLYAVLPISLTLDSHTELPVSLTLGLHAELLGSLTIS